MTRGISAALLTALQAQVVWPIYFVKLEFVGSDLYLCNRSENFSWDSQTWLGNGQLANSINGIHEQGEAESTGCQITLDCFDSSIMSLLLNSLNRSKKVTVYLGALDSAEAIVLSPVLVYQGYFEAVNFTEDSESAQAVIMYENEILGLRKINEFRYTDQSQQSLYPGDISFQYTALLPDWSGFWGKAERPKRTTKRIRNKN